MSGESRCLAPCVPQWLLNRFTHIFFFFLEGIECTIWRLVNRPTISLQFNVLLISRILKFSLIGEQRATVLLAKYV